MIKKILSNLLLPASEIILALGISILLLLLKKARKTALTFLIVSFFGLILCTTEWFPNYLLRTLESRYPPVVSPPSHVHTIVVLGGGSYAITHSPMTMKLGSASTARLIEGIRLYKLTPNAELVLSGGRAFGSAVDASIMNNVAVLLGVDPKHIKIEAGSMDTLQEAILVKKMLSDEPFLLVTSAYHMPRAMYLFHKEGLHPIAAPTQFLAKPPTSALSYFPTSGHLQNCDTAIHEYIGLLWAFLSVKTQIQK